MPAPHAFLNGLRNLRPHGVGRAEDHFRRQDRIDLEGG
jgi:hypothetical protein